MLMLILQEISILRSLEATKMFETNVSVLLLCGPKARGKTIKPIKFKYPKICSLWQNKCYKRYFGKNIK